MTGALRQEAALSLAEDTPAISRKEVRCNRVQTHDRVCGLALLVVATPIGTHFGSGKR